MGRGARIGTSSVVTGGSTTTETSYLYEGLSLLSLPATETAGSSVATYSVTYLPDASVQPIRYAGYCYDEHAGLYYLSARSYDPATRQFLTKDPVKADGEESAYQYCGGDPVGSVDPSGRKYIGTYRVGGTLRFAGSAYADVNVDVFFFGNSRLAKSSALVGINIRGKKASALSALDAYVHIYARIVKPSGSTYSKFLGTIAGGLPDSLDDGGNPSTELRFWKTPKYRQSFAYSTYWVRSVSIKICIAGTTNWVGPIDNWLGRSRPRSASSASGSSSGQSSSPQLIR